MFGEVSQEVGLVYFCMFTGQLMRAWYGLFVIGGLLMVAATSTPGCGVEPVEVEGCRKLEEARCDFGPTCGFFGDDKIEWTVDSCKDFYRDQCLHGLGLTQSPGSPAIERCVKVIKTAGACAKKGDKQCSTIKTSSETTACGIIEHPEVATDCEWLIPPASTAAPTSTGTGASDAGTEAGPVDPFDAGSG